MTYKILSLFALSISACLVTPAFATELSSEKTQQLKDLGLQCPQLVSTQLDAMKNGGTLMLNDLTFKTDMDSAEYTKAIPGNLYIISKGKNFDPSKTSFSVLPAPDGRVNMKCEYSWQSALAGITKNTHTFTLQTTTPFTLTKMNIKNENSKPLRVAIFQAGTTASSMPWQTIEKNQSKDVDFLQTDIGGNLKSALSIQNVFVQGELTSGSQDFHECPTVTIGSESKFVFESKVIGTKCVKR